MQSGNANGNGAKTRDLSRSVLAGSLSGPPPEVIADLAEGCVRHVEKAVGVKLDYQPETLPILDHYIAQARAEARVKPEILSVLAHTAGAYVGEVVRRRYASWWRTDGSDPAEWQVELESVYLAFSPMRLILEAVLRVGGDAAPSDSPPEEGVAPGDFFEADEGEGEVAQLELQEEDHAAVAARLAELPPVSEEEFYAPSTRVEVIDIAVEAIRARRLAAGEEVEAKLRPKDYERDD